VAQIALSAAPCGRFNQRDFRTHRLSSICLFVVAFVAMVSARASARDLPFLALRSSQDSALAAPWEGLRDVSQMAKRETIDSTTFVYQLIAYVTKELLDDASDEYRSSPVGAYLRKETPAQYSRSEPPSPSTSVVFLDSPANLRYRVRAGTTLGDLWSALHRRPEEDHGGLSLDPKFGAGKAGFVLSLRW
jgi:hypothetical protein